MDYATITTSALVSVVLSVLVAARVAARQEKGRAQQRAQDEVRELAQPRWREARAVELGLAKPSRRPGTIVGDDLVFAGHVLAHADGLSPWRRRLVRRRLRRLFGRMWVDYLDVNPAAGNAWFSAWIKASLDDEEQPRRYRQRARSGVYSTALDEGSAPKAARRLRRHLGLLRRGV